HMAPARRASATRLSKACSASSARAPSEVTATISAGYCSRSGQLLARDLVVRAERSDELVVRGSTQAIMPVTGRIHVLGPPTWRTGCRSRRPCRHVCRASAVLNGRPTDREIAGLLQRRAGFARRAQHQPGWIARKLHRELEQRLPDERAAEG